MECARGGYSSCNALKKSSLVSATRLRANVYLACQSPFVNELALHRRRRQAPFLPTRSLPAHSSPPPALSAPATTRRRPPTPPLALRSARPAADEASLKLGVVVARVCDSYAPSAACDRKSAPMICCCRRETVSQAAQKEGIRSMPGRRRRLRLDQHETSAQPRRPL
jgi:hypothetical protein